MRGCGAVSSSATLGSGLSDDAKDNDDFGDFASSDSAGSNVEEREEAVPQSVSSDDAAEDDDFGDFASSSKAVEEATPQPPVSSDAEGDENWGGFGSADQTASQEDNSAQPALTEATDKPPSEGENDVEGDDWGDFGCADQFELKQEEEVAPQAVDQAEADAEDDWGDFGSADQLEAKQDKAEDVAPSPNNTQESDDDWGDFGDAPQGTTSVPSTSNDTPKEDDWGDFGSSSQPDPQQNSIPAGGNADDDDDDWGDFGSADNDGFEEEQLKADNGSNEATDDNDFGDFGSAEFADDQETTSNEKFGDFSDHPIATPEDVVIVPPIGDVGDKARDFFTKMQSKYASQADAGDENGEKVLPFAIDTTVASFISSSQAASIPANHSVSMLVETLWKGRAVEKGKPSLIIDDDGDAGLGPYSIFMYPTGGFHAPQKEVESERQRRASSIRLDRVPDILPIQLPQGKEMPLNVSSPVSRQKKPVKVTNADTVVLPDLGKDKPTAPESDVEKLKASIPDLSFMLQSTLVLPD